MTRCVSFRWQSWWFQVFMPRAVQKCLAILFRSAMNASTFLHYTHVDISYRRYQVEHQCLASPTENVPRFESSSSWRQFKVPGSWESSEGAAVLVPSDQQYLQFERASKRL